MTKLIVWDDMPCAKDLESSAELKSLGFEVEVRRWDTPGAYRVDGSTDWYLAGSGFDSGVLNTPGWYWALPVGALSHADLVVRAVRNAHAWRLSTGLDRPPQSPADPYAEHRRMLAERGVESINAGISAPKVETPATLLADVQWVD